MKTITSLGYSLCIALCFAKVFGAVDYLAETTTSKRFSREPFHTYARSLSHIWSFSNEDAVFRKRLNRPSNIYMESVYQPKNIRHHGWKPNEEVLIPAPIYHSLRGFWQTFPSTGEGEKYSNYSQIYMRSVAITTYHSPVGNVTSVLLISAAVFIVTRLSKAFKIVWNASADNTKTIQPLQLREVNSP